MTRSDYGQSLYDQPPAKSRKKAKKKYSVLASLIVGVVFLAFGLGMWNAGFVDFYDGYVETTGTIVSVDRHSSCRNGDCSPVGFPTIEYAVDGEKITSQSDIGSGSYGGSDVGRQVKVKYDPSDPSDMSVAGDADFVELIMKFIVGGFMGLGALCIVISLMNLLKKAISLVTPF